MAYQEHFNFSYRYSLMRTGYEHLTINNVPQLNFQAPKSDGKCSVLRESSVNYSSMPPLEYIETDSPLQSDFDRDSYKHEHPKKKFRETYYRELAEKHTSTSSTRSFPCSSSFLENSNSQRDNSPPKLINYPQPHVDPSLYNGGNDDTSKYTNSNLPALIPIETSDNLLRSHSQPYSPGQCEVVLRLPTTRYNLEDNHQGIPNQGIPNQGITNQGITNQGIQSQGIPSQGIPNKGIPSQGIPNQGIPNQGIPNQGIPNQGIPNQGIPSQGIPRQGIPRQGIPNKRIPRQGIPNKRIPNQGIPNQGIPSQGIPSQGIPSQGIPSQGIPSQGIPSQGIPSQGIPSQGIPSQGILSQGIPSQGIPSERESSLDRPQDLRVRRKAKELRDVANGILNAPSIPHLNPRDIPFFLEMARSAKGCQESIPLKHRDYFDRHNKRLSGEVSTLNTIGPPDVQSYPKFDRTGSYSSAFNRPYSPSFVNHGVDTQGPLQDCSPKEPTPPEKEVYPPSPYFEMREKEFSPRYSMSPEKSDDQEAYLRKPIEEWAYEDVIYFLMKACNELGIYPSDVDFKRSTDGPTLLRMSPYDFEELAPTKGQSLYSYFLNFKNNHCINLDSRNIPPHRYNYQDSTCYPSNIEPSYAFDNPSSSNKSYSPTHNSHNFESDIERSPQFNHYARSPPYSSHPSDSPSNEYIPQGHQYADHFPFHPDTESSLRKSYELPSAAGKTFRPLHNPEDPVSDPDEVDDPPLKTEKKRGPGRPPKPESERKRKTKKTGRLWEFIRNLLLDPKTCPSLLRWEDAHEGTFRITNSEAIANKWGMRKNNQKMNYEKLSRAMRYYYKAKIFEPVFGKRLVYKFGSNATGWRPLNLHNPNFE